MSVVATRNDLLYPLVVSAHPDIGFYQLRFYLNQKWRIVTVDDFVPIKFSQLRFAKCADKDELWVPLMVRLRVHDSMIVFHNFCCRRKRLPS